MCQSVLPIGCDVMKSETTCAKQFLDHNFQTCPNTGGSTVDFVDEDHLSELVEAVVELGEFGGGSFFGSSALWSFVCRVEPVPLLNRCCYGQITL
jgi:hypothetical protein